MEKPIAILRDNDISSAICEGKELVLLTGTTFDPSYYDEFKNWACHGLYITSGSLDTLEGNTVLRVYDLPDNLNHRANQQLCYYHDNRHGPNLDWIKSMVDKYEIIKVTKPWQVTGAKRREEIPNGIEKLHPKNQFIVDSISNIESAGLVSAICTFWVPEQERICFRMDDGNVNVTYKACIKGLFNAYFRGEATLVLYNPVAVRLLCSVGCLRLVDQLPETIPPCSNHNVCDVQHGPPTMMHYLRKSSTSPSSYIRRGQPDVAKGRSNPSVRNNNSPSPSGKRNRKVQNKES
jgi:hypothetical protein